MEDINKINQRIFYDCSDIANKEYNLFIDLKNCNCCERHNTNKPEYLYKIVENKKQKLDIKDINIVKNQCKCPCRHTMRLLQKQYIENNNWYYKNLSKKPTNEKLSEKKYLFYDTPERTPGWHNY